MKAGRELDALVAEKVMGYSLHRLVNYPTREPTIIIPTDEFPQGFWKIPHYSTSIADAWMVVGKMHHSNSYMTLNSGGREEIVWEVEIRRYPYDEEMPADVFKVLADTAPEAICLAALKAVGVEA